MATSLARNLGNLGNVLSTNGQYATQITPPALDSSTNVATTAFVKNSGKTYANIYTVSASGSIPSSYQGAIVTTSTGGLTLTLPPLGSSPNGFTLTFLNTLTTGNITIKGNTTELINSVVTPAGSNTFTLYPGEAVEIVSKVTSWIVVNYTQFNSPAFNTPTVTTAPAQYDNTTKIPNTAWLASRGVQWASTSRDITVTSTTLVAADIGSMIYFNSGSQSCTLPNMTGVIAGASIGLNKLNGGTANYTLTVTSNGSMANIDNGQGIAATITLTSGDSTILFWTGTGWVCTGTYPFRIGYIAQQITALNTSINNEVTNRTNSFNSLQSQISTEVTNRANGDSNLQGQINNEVTNRANGDNNLQNQINNIRSAGGVGSYYFIQQSSWSGGFGPGGTGTISGVGGNWQLTSTTQIAGDNVGLGYRYA